MSDIVDRLLRYDTSDARGLCREAGELIRQLRSSVNTWKDCALRMEAERNTKVILVERQNAALKPFVEAFKKANAENSPYHNVTVGSAADRLFYQDFERAAEAFSPDERDA